MLKAMVMAKMTNGRMPVVVAAVAGTSEFREGMRIVLPILISFQLLLDLF